MRHRFLGAAATAFALVVASHVCHADILDLTDGQRQPKDEALHTGWGEVPADDELEATASQDLSLSYDKVSLKRRDFDAATVKEFWVSETRKNQDYNAGELYGERGYWTEAAESFATAAEALKGAGKEYSLYKRVLALANSGDADATLAAADALVAAFPKTYFMGSVQEMRARIFASTGKMRDASAALDVVINASGMNVRDLFNAKYFQIWLTKYVGISTPAQFEAAEKAFRDLLQEIDRNPGRANAGDPRLKTQLSLAECLRGQGKTDEAEKIFQQIQKAANAGTDRSILAGVYYGLGDVAFERAAALQTQGGNKNEVKNDLETAALHYLRVVLQYRSYAGQRELYGATRGAARVFASLFQLTDDKDCDLARRSYEFYRQAVDLQTDRDEKRTLVREGKALKQRLDAACGDASSDSEGSGD